MTDRERWAALAARLRDQASFLCDTALIDAANAIEEMLRELDRVQSALKHREPELAR